MRERKTERKNSVKRLSRKEGSQRKGTMHDYRRKAWTGQGLLGWKAFGPKYGGYAAEWG